ncbi:chromatin remodelling complex Rsc7/Swp82 subunit-domain-containing protein [Lophiotrema nucula]|uniref:Chromatin remodelling complex Rsc7/Swp82 subunit-domain-containing protein n=1 Tax=Lophiotrema nucula TaxID=690887 RepID=A0A6A5ZR41_9PLEO|nr:chromatin remodelling complex Rsc7/Swp82 subunit-domain-containing protein [Lophiotrema nucula]
MYSMHPVPLTNGGLGNGIMDPSGTINPAALNSAVIASVTSAVASRLSWIAANTVSPGVLQGPPQAVAQQQSRGIKRSRSPENSYGEILQGDNDDDGKPRKRGRPPKSSKVSFAESPQSAQPPATPSQNASAPPVQTPQLQHSSLPQTSPSQASPSKTTPTKPTVLKALPTVRDHTTDQLNAEGDEYLPREVDEAGERKVTATGHPLDGREYRCRTFYVPNRGDKLFMLATECARVLGYRDSYLLFNKNRSLYKIIATQPEKDDLIHQEILPYSYRSRQIAIVTARSMFRQFGSRIIVNGRRVRDDYWESKARKQGFTEEDAAGEKRPGAAKAREAAAAEANASLHGIPYTHPGPFTGKLDQDYLATGMNPLQAFGGISPAPGAIPPTNIDQYAQRTTSDLQPRDYGSVQRPRQELSGVAYQDITRPSPSGEILNQAAQTAEFNKQLNQQQKNRKEYLDNYWNRPHEPAPQTSRPATAEGDSMPQVSQAIQSPHISSVNVAAAGNQHGMVARAPQPQGQPMGAQGYRQQPMPQSTMVPSPRAPAHTPLRNEQVYRRPPSMAMPNQGMPPTAMRPGMMAQPGAHGQSPGHGYVPQNMWPQAGPPQPSPLSQQHNIQYAQHPAQPSPHPQQSPIHASPQLHHTQSSGSMHGTPVQQYQTMSAMGADQGYPAMAQSPYQPSPSPHQFMHPSTAAQQPGMPGWAPGGQGPQQTWQSY